MHHNGKWPKLEIDNNGNSFFASAISGQTMAPVVWLFWSGCNFTDELKCLFLLCVLVGHVEVVKLLVSRSADKSCKDKQGYTPLHAAAASGHIEIVKYLLRMGSEVSLCHCHGPSSIWNSLWPFQVHLVLCDVASVVASLSDWWAQRVWKHSPPCGVLHGAGGGGYWAGEPRS